MFDRHTNRNKYFAEQVYTTKNFVIPYINEVKPISKDLIIAEIGCGEAGNLMPFLDMGCKVVGIDISESKIDNAKKMFADHPLVNQTQFIACDIYKVDPNSLPKFDLIIMRDVIEHIPNQEKFIPFLKNFLAPEAKVFFGFPPWRMPFGGHQQVCKNKFLSVLPYFHLFPKPIFKMILKLFGESDGTIQTMFDNVDTGISITRFKRIIKNNNWHIDKETLYFINPNYEIKFKLKTRILPSFFHIPWLKDFYTTAYYGIVSTKN
jgi:SAM-dependent methyltransferase